MDIDQVIGFIAAAGKEEAKKIQDAAWERLKWHRQLDNMNIRATLVRGTRVSWKSKTGRSEVGKVLAVNTSTVKVKADNGVVWQVSLALLSPERGV